MRSMREAGSITIIAAKKPNPKNIGFNFTVFDPQAMTDLESRLHEHFHVPVIEERGFRHYVWFPDFPGVELEARWTAAPACGMKGLLEYFGGEWLEITEAQFDGLPDLNQHRAHVCCDADSYLITPDLHVMVHAGFDWEQARGTDDDPAVVQAYLRRQANKVTR
ncbi:hypothetical protein [Noviherbaspirillum galbum]|uniref:Uncharacterized protein n=1 Tax=Noviherbaspirillum galbum TaxID=2709383 RepID=A0A6B3SQV1_9BURK|nr:hypothetical protein [Noviherbaspirillum galbum]NEX60039.1 hypothetical protein [Noviherbaspirillum galbum]